MSVCQIGQLISPQGWFQCQDSAVIHRRLHQGFHTVQFGTSLDNVPVQETKSFQCLPQPPSPQPQILAQLKWCAPAAIQADRLHRSWAGHMLLRAWALNFWPLDGLSVRQDKENKKQPPKNCLSGCLTHDICLNQIAGRHLHSAGNCQEMSQRIRGVW